MHDTLGRVYSRSRAHSPNLKNWMEWERKLCVHTWGWGTERASLANNTPLARIHIRIDVSTLCCLCCCFAVAATGFFFTRFHSSRISTRIVHTLETSTIQNSWISTFYFYPSSLCLSTNWSIAGFLFLPRSPSDSTKLYSWCVLCVCTIRECGECICVSVFNGLLYLFSLQYTKNVSNRFCLCSAFLLFSAKIS